MGSTAKSLPRLCVKNSIQRIESRDIAVLKKHGLQISKLNKERPGELLTEITLLISGIYNLVNVGKQINERSIVTLAKMIIEKYWHLKIDEIDLVFRNGITGNYGKIYDRVDASVIFDWLQQYDVGEECISIYEENSSSLAVLAAEAKGEWKPPTSRSEPKEHQSSILDIAEFRDRVKKVMEIKEPVENTKTDEEHREMIKEQAKVIMKNNKKIKK